MKGEQEKAYSLVGSESLCDGPNYQKTKLSLTFAKELKIHVQIL